jgi:hypothetical protein
METPSVMYIRTSRAVYANVGYVQLAELTILSLPCRVCKPDKPDQRTCTQQLDLMGGFAPPPFNSLLPVST